MTSEGLSPKGVRCAQTDDGRERKTSSAHSPVPLWGNSEYWACATILGTNLNSKEEI